MIWTSGPKGFLVVADDLRQRVFGQVRRGLRLDRSSTQIAGLLARFLGVLPRTSVLRRKLKDALPKRDSGLVERQSRFHVTKSAVVIADQLKAATDVAKIERVVGNLVRQTALDLQ